MSVWRLRHVSDRKRKVSCLGVGTEISHKIFRIVFLFLQEEVVLKVKAYDADPGNAGDLLEVLTSTLTITPDTGQGNATSHAIELQARTL